MPKANYKPEPMVVNSIAPAAVAMRLSTNLSTVYWNLVLVEGLAKYSATATILKSAAVVLWLTANPPATATIGTADYLTFTDDAGRYAITIPTGRDITMRVYS